MKAQIAAHLLKHVETADTKPVVADTTKPAAPPASPATPTPMTAIEPTKDAKSLAQASTGSAKQRPSGNSAQFVLDVLSGKIGQGDAASKAYKRVPTSEEKRQWVRDMMHDSSTPLPSSREYVERKFNKATEEFNAIKAEIASLEKEFEALKAKLDKDPSDALAWTRIDAVQDQQAQVERRALFKGSEVFDWKIELGRFD